MLMLRLLLARELGLTRMWDLYGDRGYVSAFVNVEAQESRDIMQ